MIVTNFMHDQKLEIANFVITEAAVTLLASVLMQRWLYDIPNAALEKLYCQFQMGRHVEKNYD